MRVVGIIQARLGSKRLEGKVLADICGEPMLGWLLKRVSQAKSLEQIIIATTESPNDDVLEDWIENNTEFDCFRGNEDDVLARYYHCAKFYKADIIVRITADDPLKDPAIIDRAVKLFKENPELDYCSNCLEFSFPEGLDVEVFRFSALCEAFEKSTLLSDREHVTSYITNNTQMFNLLNFKHHEDLSAWRWTVDKPRDLAFMRKIFEHIKDKPSLHFEEIISYIKKNPSLVKINEGTVRFEGYLTSVAMERDLNDN